MNQQQTPPGKPAHKPPYTKRDPKAAKVYAPLTIDLGQPLVKPLMPGLPKVAPFPEPRMRQFSNDVFFRDAEELPPVPVIPPVPRPGPRRSELTDRFEAPLPVRHVYRQPSVQANVRPVFKYTPGPVRTDITQAMLGLDQDDDARGSGGTTIQMLAVGPQNYALDINPQMSFFRAVFRRHTPVSIECFDQDVDLRFGAATTVTIPRRGDMLGDVVLEVRLPNLGIAGGTWADAIGYVLMTRARLVLDDVVIHDHERLWYDMVDRLYMPHGRKAGIDAMIGRGKTLATDREHTVFLPFKFFCCKAHHASQQFLPLVSLASRRVLTLEFTTEGLAACVSLPAGASLPPVPPPVRAKLLTEQMFVDTDERLGLVRQRALLAVESFQDVDAVSYLFDDSGQVGVTTVRLDLREVNLPVRALLFVAYDENAVDKKRYFDYLDCVSSATLMLGSSQRFSERSGDYFSLVQTYQHAARCSDDRVNIYSFAMDASARQPCGALNFAAVDAPVLKVGLKNTSGRSVKVKAFAHCINWLSIEDGSMTFVFSV